MVIIYQNLFAGCFSVLQQTGGALQPNKFQKYIQIQERHVNSYYSTNTTCLMFYRIDFIDFCKYLLILNLTKATHFKQGRQKIVCFYFLFSQRSFLELVDNV